MTYKGKSSLKPFLDLMLILLCTCLAIIMLVQNKTTDATPTFKDHAIYQLVMSWPDGSRDDMDMWVQDPTGNTVSFNRKEGGDGCLMSLDHDDLGSRNDIMWNGSTNMMNQEVVSVRGVIPDGEYIVNGHCYNKVDANKVEVEVKLIVVKTGKVATEGGEPILIKRFFYSDGDEFTFFRFIIDSRGKIAHSEKPIQITANNQ